MALTLCVKNEAVEASAAAGKKPHRYRSLKVDEVSIVTDPAILSSDEADMGVGFPVVKFTDEGNGEGLNALAEKVTLRSGEDINGWLDRLTSEAKLSLTVSMGEGEAYFYYPVKVFSDSIIMTDPYTNPLANDAMFFKMSFNQSEEGDFSFGNPEMLKLTFAASGITSEKVMQTRKEVPMADLIGVEFGGQVLKVSATPGLEFKSEDGELIVMCDDEGVVKTGEGYVIHEDGIVRSEKTNESNLTDGTGETTTATTTTETTGEEIIELATGEEGTEVSTGTTAEIEIETAEGGTTEETTKLAVTFSQMQELMKASGSSFKMTMSSTGDVEIVPIAGQQIPGFVENATEQTAETAETSEKSELEVRLEQLEGELQRTRQQLAGSSTTDPEVGEAANKIFGISNYPRETPRVAADGKPEQGIFTRHIDKRLLDRRSRLNADLVSG